MDNFTTFYSKSYASAYSTSHPPSYPTTYAAKYPTMYPATYSRSSHDGSSVEKKKLWNPSETLGIKNMDPGYQRITCVGYAPSQGRRCRKAIRASNIQLIEKTLDDISYLPPDSPEVASRLQTIASPALCVQFHQNQAREVMGEWQQKARQAKPQKEEQIYSRATPSTKIQHGEQNQALKEAQEQLEEIKRMMAEMREELRTQRHQDADLPSQGVRERDCQQQEEARKRQEREERERDARRREAERIEKERQEEEERREKKRREEEEEEEERLEKERKEKERQEAERKEKAQKEKANKETEGQERRARSERIRQKAQKAREERERAAREKAQKERAEWDQAWQRYQAGWVAFRAQARPSDNESIRGAIPWPVKSGRYGDVKASSVKEFFEQARPREVEVAWLVRRECLKWHSDRKKALFGEELAVADEIMVDMICRVLTDLLNGAAARSAEFRG